MNNDRAHKEGTERTRVQRFIPFLDRSSDSETRRYVPYKYPLLAPLKNNELFSPLDERSSAKSYLESNITFKYPRILRSRSIHILDRASSIRKIILKVDFTLRLRASGTACCDTCARNEI